MNEIDELISHAYVSTLPETYLSDADIVPDEIQGELINWRDTFSLGAFRIGDIANKLVKRAISLGWVVTNDRIYKAVGKFCGKSGRTVRYYAETSAFYSEDIRSLYDVLPFSHFVFARAHGDDWESVLIYAAENPEKSLSEITAYFSHPHSQMADEQTASSGPGELRNFATFSPSSYTSTANPANVVGDLLTALDSFERILPQVIDDYKNLTEMIDLVSVMRNRARNLKVTNV